MSCCPVGCEPALAAAYTARGTEIKLDGLTCYTVGESNKAIIVYYDVFGFNGGRIRLICDQLADAGFYVILPDYYHGDAWPADKPMDTLMDWLKAFSWESGLKNDTEKVLKHLDSKNIKTIGSLGFCAGAYPVFHLSGLDNSKIKCGASAHPSLQICGVYGETPDKIADAVKCPQLCFPAGGDPDFYKPGGSVYGILKKKFGDQFVYEEFKEMNHGWVPRGDLNKANVARDVKKAMESFIAFFNKHLC